MRLQLHSEYTSAPPDLTSLQLEVLFAICSVVAILISLSVVVLGNDHNVLPWLAVIGAGGVVGAINFHSWVMLSRILLRYGRSDGYSVLGVLSWFSVKILAIILGAFFFPRFSPGADRAVFLLCAVLYPLAGVVGLLVLRGLGLFPFKPPCKPSHEGANPEPQRCESGEFRQRLD